MTKHRWTRTETYAVTLCYKRGLSPDVAHERCPAISLKSIKCKYANCRYLDRGTGMSHVSALHRDVWNELSTA
jgi:hypothetical protein